MNRLFSFFIPEQENCGFDILLKSKTLIVFTSVIVVVLPVLWLLVIIVLRHSVFSILSFFILLIIVSNALSLFIMRWGRYLLAADVFVLTSMAGFSVYLLFGSFKFDVGVLVSGYHIFIFLVFSTLFCRKRTMIIVAILALAVQVTAILSSGGLSRGLKIMGIINFSFEMILVTAICFLIVSITDRIMALLREEADGRADLEQVRDLLVSVSGLSEQLAGSSSLMSKTTDVFSANAQNQAASAEEITATMEEISAGVESISDIASVQVTKMDGLAVRLDELSGQISGMKQMIADTLKMTLAISEEARSGESSLKQMDDSMKSMSSRSSEMASIIEIINDISDKINLLSLNAAIEAARAGDAGRGFAVVADEISKLADRTFSSVKEIGALIRAGEDETKHGGAIVGTVVMSLSRIIEGVARINSMVESMSGFMTGQFNTNQEVNREASDVKERSEEIKNASMEQKNATNEIVKSIATITELTQANAQGAEDMALRSKEITEIAMNLNRSVEDFGDR